MDISKEFDENFIAQRITFPFKPGRDPKADAVIISCSVMMSKEDYAAALSDLRCPKNQQSAKFYLFMKVHGAVLCHAPDDFPVLSKRNLDGQILTAYNFGVGANGMLTLHRLDNPQNDEIGYNTAKSGFYLKME